MKSKIWSVAVSVCIAFLMWYYVISVVSPDSVEWRTGIPVIFEGETVLTEDRGMIITSNIDDIEVDLKLSGTRTDLAKVNDSNITIKVDLTKVYDPGEHELAYSYSFPSDVPTGALTVESKKPGTIKITVEKRVRKTVEVKVYFTGSAAESYMADTENRVLDHQFINISGPSSMVEQIDHARIDVDLTNRVESISEDFQYVLCDKDGNPAESSMVTTDATEIHMDMRIFRFKEVPLTLQLTYGGGACEDSVEVTVEPSSINVSGSDALLEDLEMIQLGSIDLSAMTEDMEQTYPITLPDGITNLSGRTEAMVTVKFLNLDIRELDISQITAINVPEGMEAVLMDQVLKIRFRGPVGVIENLTSEDVTVVVDFSGKEAGSFTIKPTITIRESAYSKVGAVGSYSINATLRELPEEETEES